MIRIIAKIACAAAYWACIIGAGEIYGLKAAGFVLAAGMLIAIFFALEDAEEPESDYDFDARVVIDKSGNAKVSFHGIDGIIRYAAVCMATMEECGIDMSEIKAMMEKATKEEHHGSPEP